ncbi:FAD-dependent oxidoreductase, partial [Streptomyces achromogenes]|uniref:FAD-dependent oxidoreductase n=1 Tax=Streptomyces achromogenes TaxID=67255 RepID=UPI0033D2B800
MTRALPGPTDHVVVVGAGLAGLSATLHLLGAGRRVTVVEREEAPGGRAGRLDLAGYRIDTGPTVLTMPDLADEAFAAVGESLYERAPPGGAVQDRGEAGARSPVPAPAGLSPAGLRV